MAYCDGAAMLASTKCLAERTGLEPATPGVTGRYSNQLNYRSAAACLTVLLDFVTTLRCQGSLELHARKTGVP